MKKLLVVQLALPVFAAVIGLAPVVSACAESPTEAARSATELEHEFWVCDHAATRTALDSGTAALCSAVTEQLRKLRFGGDFSAMLDWWQEHKTAAHLAIHAQAVPTYADRRPLGQPAQHSSARPVASLDAASPDELKAAYLHCDRLATTEYFDTPAAAQCQIVYEALKARVFGGNFERPLDWMRQQQVVKADPAVER